MALTAAAIQPPARDRVDVVDFARTQDRECDARLLAGERNRRKLERYGADATARGWWGKEPKRILILRPAERSFPRQQAEDISVPETIAPFKKSLTRGAVQTCAKTRRENPYGHAEREFCVLSRSARR